MSNPVVKSHHWHVLAGTETWVQILEHGNRLYSTRLFYPKTNKFEPLVKYDLSRDEDAYSLYSDINKITNDLERISRYE